MNQALIVFVRNPELGKVKTRIAKTMGEENALKVYKFLLLHTKEIISPINIPVFIYYEDHLVENDIWKGPFNKKLQSGDELGMKMHNAFSEMFALGFSKVIVIGSDCYELTAEMIIRAFNHLDMSDIILGPAVDGGYYLLGMKKLIPELFTDKIWGSSTVFSETIRNIHELELSVDLLPVLNDVDEEKDVTFDYMTG